MQSKFDFRESYIMGLLWAGDCSNEKRDYSNLQGMLTKKKNLQGRFDKKKKNLQGRIKGEGWGN